MIKNKNKKQTKNLDFLEETLSRNMDMLMST